MNIFLGKEDVDKTTSLLQYTYDYLDALDNEMNYAIIITSKCSPYLNDLKFGKYDIVKKGFLDRILIKVVEKYEDLINILENFKLISAKNLPAILAVDRVHMFFNTVSKY